MILFRSILFNLLFYLTLAIYCIAAIPTLFLPRRAILTVAKAWAVTNHWLLRVVCGIHYELRGADRIPDGSLIVAAKHQSVWETFTLLLLVRDPVYILKRELLYLPLFGWYAWKAGMIPVDRGKGTQALLGVTARARQSLAQGAQILIFPEGTRRAPGAEPRYKHGVVYLYDETGAACLPIALNAGLFWPRRSFLRYPGTVIVEILDPIPPGLDKKDFAARMQDAIETATARLVAEGRRELAAQGITPRAAAAES